MLPSIILSKNKTNDLYLFLISIPIFLILDFVFLFYNRDNFERQIIQIQRVSVVLKPIGAILCYFFLLLGLYYFILREKKTPLEAFLFGIIIYGVYETTTYAVLKNWKFTNVIMDTLWGGILFYLTTYITYYLYR
jgi:uncharacterized membrane protein